MITHDLHNFHSGFIGHNMVIYDSRGYSGPMGVTLQLHNALCNHKVTQRKVQDLKSNGLELLERKNWYPSKTGCLCSEHFNKSCFIEGKTNHRLHKNAVLSVFPQFPKQLQKSDFKIKSPKKCKLIEPSTVTCDQSLYIGRHSPA